MLGAQPPDKIEEENNSRWLLWVLIVSCAFHALAAVFSVGFYHADEHFQVLEFMNFKLGQVPAADLPLEFREQMRPWLLPSLLELLTKALQIVGITNPFHWAIVYRLFSSVCSGLAIGGLSLACTSWFADVYWRRIAVLALNFLWFVPAFHARPSSENLSGAFVFLGISALVLGKKRWKDAVGLYSLVGILWGIAFEFRYQVGVMIAGAILWLLAIQRTSLKKVASLIAGLILMIGLGTVLDRWGYGEWTFAPWNYFRFNLIQNHVSDIDTSPWWDFFRRSFTETWPLLGWITFVSCLMAWVAYPLHLLTWACLPLYLVHQKIGHKELRFLFPLVHASGIFLAQAGQTLSSYFKNEGQTARKAVRWIASLLMAWNLLGYVALSFAPAWAPVLFYERLSRWILSTPQAPATLYYEDTHPFKLGGVTLHLYQPKNLRFVPLPTADQLSSDRAFSEPFLLFRTRPTLPQTWEKNFGFQCQVLFKTLPTDFQPLILERVTNWTLFRCEKAAEKSL